MNLTKCFLFFIKVGDNELCNALVVNRYRGAASVLISELVQALLKRQIQQMARPKTEEEVTQPVELGNRELNGLELSFYATFKLEISTYLMCMANRGTVMNVFNILLQQM